LHRYFLKESVMKQSQRQYANSGEISKRDEVILHPTGREGTPLADRDTAAANELETTPSTQPTDAHFDVGSGDEETDDGLNAETEAVRQAAEESALESSDEDAVPVFDRANRSERI
jgi:hypothetical protein